MQLCLQYFGRILSKIIIPYTAQQITVLCGIVDEWAIQRCGYLGEIDNHYPKHPLISFFKEHPVIFPKMTATASIPPEVFTQLPAQVTIFCEVLSLPGCNTQGRERMNTSYIG